METSNDYWYLPDSLIWTNWGIAFPCRLGSGKRYMERIPGQWAVTDMWSLLQRALPHPGDMVEPKAPSPLDDRALTVRALPWRAIFSRYWPHTQIIKWDALNLFNWFYYQSVTRPTLTIVITEDSYVPTCDTARRAQEMLNSGHLHLLHCAHQQSLYSNVSIQ